MVEFSCVFLSKDILCVHLESHLSSLRQNKTFIYATTALTTTAAVASSIVSCDEGNKMNQFEIHPQPY
jgi:hypothetical protein